jgi:DNA-binding transcriptional LysR family regulator
VQEARHTLLSLKFTLRQIEYFIAAAESGSILAASQRANISAPSVSTAIAHLEREFGVRLFVRHHAQGLSLTPAGRSLLRAARLGVRQMEGLYAAATENGQLRGTLNVGCLVTLAPMVMPELAQLFMRANPGCSIAPTAQHQEGLVQGLRRAQIDVAITYDLQAGEDIAFEPLVALPPYALFGASDALRRRRSVRLAELARQPLILLDLPISREYLLGLFLRADLNPHVAWRSPHPEVIRSMVANGFGYALFNGRPKSLYALDGRRLYPVRIAGSQPPTVLGLASLKGHGGSRLLQAFAAHCREQITTRQIPGMTAAIAGWLDDPADGA